MNISLTPELEQLIDQRVKSGLYNSASEVIREALRLLIENDQLKQMKKDELRRQLQIGVEASKRGEVLSEDKVMNRIRAKHEKGSAGKGKKN